MVDYLLPFEKRIGSIRVFEKRKSVSDPSMGCVPKDYSTDVLLKSGIFILDKPSGPTSHQAVDYVKRVLKIDKAGHSGTLDPGVTGVLPVAIKDSTRVTNALLTAGKEYICLMHLHKDVSEEELIALFDKFTGNLKQLPPKKSAVKRQLRVRTVYYIEYMERNDRDVLFRVGCQAGTYIRKLVHDMGEELGCGAHMAELRRTKAGPFKEDMAVTLQDLKDAFHYYGEGDDSYIRKMIYPVEYAVSHLKKIWVLDAAIDTLCHGAYLKVPGISKLDSDIDKGDVVAVLSLKGELVLVGEALLDSGNLNGFDKGLAVKTQQVFMKPDTYKK
ncbi:RNA-guided pseudouridylation complex pseudouridine synthase subunit Cbf5 [Candidatus Woesearchaeota archaeon]|nr:RNA-guided pseudouridylation complex pseudouridine synthase subunit Cbf5 [Candidatus Woesearchaeota archaeon]MCF8013867.1 RNA-guided pseudouridylation complex pseudouridine synthase subunit Cbf5 [Candidatus Woesearchaeota archaeon]